ncbi:N-acetylmuramoyl-L-alanine amidase family protein [Cytobacillus sp. Hm23]
MKLIHKHLIKGNPQINQGVKKGNHLWVIRKTIMPSVLVECGFMDNLEEALLMINPNFKKSALSKF